MSKKKKNSLGFTLFELLVVIFIIGLISSILINNWRSNEKQYQLQRAAQEIAQNIRKTQDMALISLRQDGIVPPNYGIFFEITNPNYYRIFADENGNNLYDDPGATVVNLESGLEIDSISPSPRLHITFSIPDGFTTIRQPANNTAVITIKEEGGTCPDDCINIVVEMTGRVSIDYE